MKTMLISSIWYRGNIKLMNKKVLIAISCFLVLAIAILVFYRGTIFQRGNPLPYISKMFTLSDSNQYSKVFDDKDIYLTRSGSSNYDDLITHIESTWKVTFIEQMGSTLMFKSEDINIFASTEVYWSKYIVWELTFQQ